MTRFVDLEGRGIVELGERLRFAAIQLVIAVQIGVDRHPGVAWLPAKLAFSIPQAIAILVEEFGTCCRGGSEVAKILRDVVASCHADRYRHRLAWIKQVRFTTRDGRLRHVGRDLQRPVEQPPCLAFDRVSHLKCPLPVGIFTVELGQQFLWPEVRRSRIGGLYARDVVDWGCWPHRPALSMKNYRSNHPRR